MRLLLLCLFYLLATACRTNEQPGAAAVNADLDFNSCNSPVRQGIEGTVYYREGNYMPSPGEGVTSPGQKVSREVLIHALTDRSQVTETDEAGLYSEVRTPLVQSVTANGEGCFRVALPPGRYSVFVREGERYFANRFDGAGNVFPIAVTADNLTKIEVVIDYAAAY